jgi:hypothetical protein
MLAAPDCTVAAAGPRAARLKMTTLEPARKER